MKKLCLILIIIATPILGYSQFKGDTVVVYVDQRAEIKLSVPDYSEAKSSNKVSDVLSDFLKLLPTIEDELSEESPETVSLKDGVSLTVEPGDSRTIYLFKDGEISNTGFRDRAFISSGKIRIVITTTDLTGLDDLSIQDCLQKVIDVLPEKRSWSKNLYYECIDGQVTFLESKNNEFDFLELNVGAGAGLIKKTWVPDFSLGVGIGFNKKGNIRFPYVSSNLLFDFDEEGNTNVNTFLNLGYGWNKKKGTGKDMIGFELGYLVSQQGDLFGENTFKLGAVWSPVKGVFVSPQLYVTDNFKTVYPAIRIGFGF